MLPNILDFDRICRMCLSNSENLTNLFSSGEDMLGLLKSMTALSFTVNDDFPQNICPFCLDQIQTTRLFISKCQESEQKLRLSLQSSLTKSDFVSEHDAYKNDNHRKKRVSNNLKKHMKAPDKKSTGLYKYPCNDQLSVKSHSEEQIVNDEPLVPPRNDSLESQHSCLICNKTFAKLMNLERHKVIHENCESKPNSFQCTVCGKQMKHANHFKIHMRSHRNFGTNSKISTDEITENKKQFVCSHCGIICTSRSNLAVHTRRHTGIMTNFCKLCGKGYPRSTDLTIHMRKHTGEKPFCCKICNRTFARSDKLTIHVRTHTGEKPYSCENCKRCFAQRNDLISHQRRNVCGESL